MRVVITGGGTGGHLKVADALIQEYHNRGIKPIFIGSKNGQDQEWFKEDKRLLKAYFLDTKGVVNKKGFGKLASLFQIIKGINRCFDIFDEYDVKTVISVGGFSAAPATFTSILYFGCNLYIHEQNSVRGKLNSLTSRFAKHIFSSFDMDSIVKDYPVSNEFFDSARIRDEINKIIFLGGSQGAKGINDFALSVVPTLNRLGLKIIHQTGKSDFDRVFNEYKRLKIDADVFPFSKDIAQKMSEADFAISRAGASTLWELCANSLPTLFVPYPYAAQDHQYTNAKFLFDRDLAYVCRESELSEDLLIKILKKDNFSISKRLVNSINCNGAALMVDLIEEGK